MDTIKFNQNWNKKIFCTAFTTIRTPQPRFVLGNSYEILLQDIPVKECKIIDIRTIELIALKDSEAYLDAGVNRNKFFEIIRDLYGTWPVQMSVITLFTTKVYKDAKTNLFLKEIETLSEKITSK
jgi:hypothetical protein